MYRSWVYRNRTNQDLLYPLLSYPGAADARRLGPAQYTHAYTTIHVVTELFYYKAQSVNGHSPILCME
jgi:hypothetical protein